MCDSWESGDFPRADGGLRSAAGVNDVVVVDVHQHGDGLTDDERHPHGRVSVDSFQVSAHEQRQGNLRGGQEEGTLQTRRDLNGIYGGRGDVTYLSHHSHEGPQSEHPQRNAHQELDHEEKRVKLRSDWQSKSDFQPIHIETGQLRTVANHMKSFLQNGLKPPSGGGFTDGFWLPMTLLYATQEPTSPTRGRHSRCDAVT